METAMKKFLIPLAICGLALPAVLMLSGAGTPPAEAEFAYAADGQVRFPTDYRQWVFLSSGVGMTYGPIGAANRTGPPMFDNVFVNPKSYREFLKTGHWPDKTMFVLEVRTSESHASINKDGHFQTDIMGIETEVKDRSAKTGEWTFYGFGDVKNAATAVAKPIGREASCYTCHGKNTAVENTFVQFYPVLYDVAQKKGTLNAGFRELPVTPMRLLNLIEEKGWSAGAAALDAAAAQSVDSAVLDPASLDMLSGHLMQAKRPNDAVALLRWTAAKHPEMAGLQDSLADAYAAAGDKESARSATRLSLELAGRDSSLSPEQRDALRKSAADRLKQLQ
jgi:Cytochrome P460